MSPPFDLGDLALALLMAYSAGLYLATVWISRRDVR